jgi:hypothetical protein
MSTQPADNSGDIVVTDRELYDDAISNEPAVPETPAPASEAAPEPQPTPQTPDVPRDQQGRFAPKPPDAPSQGQQAATTRQGVPQQPPQQPPQQRQPEDHRVPVATLLQERERAYRAEAELQQMRQAWTQFQAQQQAAAQQQQPPQTIFDNPEDYLRQRVIEPLRQEMQREMMERTDRQSREFANVQFGENTVNAALQDMMRVRHTPQGDATFRTIMAAGHPYGALVQWHRQARAQQAIGPDPEAWFNKRAVQLLDDPRWQAAAIERAQRSRQQQQGNGRPSNVSLPPSLSSMPSSSGRLADQGDMSNESLYRSATK